MKWPFLAAVLALLVVGCEGCQLHPAPAPVVPTSYDASAPIWDGSTPATCLDLCRHGTVLGCTWAQPTPAGATCLDVCVNNQNARIATWDLNCRTGAATCAAVDACQ